MLEANHPGRERRRRSTQARTGAAPGSPSLAYPALVIARHQSSTSLGEPATKATCRFRVSEWSSRAGEIAKSSHSEPSTLE
jgi:hypothetical protein